MNESTDSIRVLAPRWSLAGDDKLLKLLQTTHQKIVSNCREVNTRLDEMETALGETTINLQNVNNKFMALSNSQFIESRVFDDDADITSNTIPIEEHKPEATDSLTLLKQSLVVLDSAHETAEIWDDSDVDSDTEISVILKPKDAYAHRPLPYIIGSYAWKNKWHAGLVIEDSDTDSDISKHDVREVEQYSESDEDVPTDKLIPDTTISDSGSSFHSERDKEPSVPVKKQTPADIAAELAARLGNAPPRVLEEPEGSIPQTTPKPVYRPQKPVSSTIFSDEPPPIERDAYEYSSESQEEEDIFAEINKKQSYNHITTQDTLDDDLFGRKVSNEVTDSKSKVEQRNAKQKSTVFEDESEPELFAEKPKAPKDIQSNRNEDHATKKPVGGISLFGSNKGTERIGAAILKRNIRKSSLSDNESEKIKDRNTIKNYPVSDSEEENTNSDNTNNANYIFDNLFAKAKQAEQKSMKQTIADIPVVEEKPKVSKAAKTKEVKDLFSDNIFDDIDDIFTSNIKIPTKEANKNVKSIFDDDDDLFLDIAKKPTVITKPKDDKPNKSKKSIFDSDDDLFGDIKDTTYKKDEIIDKSKKTVDSEFQIAQNCKQTNNNTEKPGKNKDTSISHDITKHIKSKESEVKPKAKSKSVFDSDSDDDLFSDKVKIKKSNQGLETSKDFDSETETELFKVTKESHVILKAEPAKVLHSPSLFEEEEIDDLFINANKAKNAKASENTVIEKLITKNIPDVIKKHKDTEDIKENTLKEEKLKLDEDNIPRVEENEDVMDTKCYGFPAIATPEHKPDILRDNILINVETKNAKSNTPENIANYDIIEASQEPSNVQSSSSTDVANKDVESNLQEPDSQIDTKNVNTENVSILPEAQEPFTDKRKKKYSQDLEVTDSVFDEVPVKENQDVIFEQNSLAPLTAAFDDIFKEPPAFEKTKETKKTVNVNALFEDDSDDEALFFKKNDVISDEKPEIFTPNANFGLFNDEPPAFLDFAPKVTRKDQFNGDDDDLFSSILKKDDKHSRNEPLDIDESNENLEYQPIRQYENTTQTQYPNEENNLVSPTEIPKLVTPVKKTSKEVLDSDEELFCYIPKPDISQKEQTPMCKAESSERLEVKPKDIKTESDKKIGKLNTKDFNINVQALVPGASPKKIPKEPLNDTTDSKKVVTIDTEEIKTKEEVSKTEVDNAEPKPVKSISFESKPESRVLDNKLSKQRPRIQVKRRPSSRKARHEAVRKSVIDVDDDTDNSSSFDEPLPKIKNQDMKSKNDGSNEHKNQDGVTRTSIIDEISNENRKQDIAEISSKYSDFDDIDRMFKNDDQSKIDTLNINNEITKYKSSFNVIDSHVVTKMDTNQSKEVSKTQNEENTSKTKVVYILNDEDIFTNKNAKHKDTETSSIIQTNEVKQESSKADQSTIKKDTKSMFNLSDDDDDLFGKSSKPKKVEVKSKLFESDSEEDIFSTKKKNKEVKENLKEGKAKGSLFGDDDDDDLFGVKTKTSAQSTKASTSSRLKEAAKSTNIVFDDPLSMLEGD